MAAEIPNYPMEPERNGVEVPDVSVITAAALTAEIHIKFTESEALIEAIKALAADETMIERVELQVVPHIVVDSSIRLEAVSRVNRISTRKYLSEWNCTSKYIHIDDIFNQGFNWDMSNFSSLEDMTGRIAKGDTRYRMLGETLEAKQWLHQLLCNLNTMHTELAGLRRALEGGEPDVAGFAELEVSLAEMTARLSALQRIHHFSVGNPIVTLKPPVSQAKNAPFWIRIARAHGRIVDLEIEPTATIRQVKEKYSLMEGGLPVRDQIMAFRRTVLDDNDTLEARGINSSATISCS